MKTILAISWLTCMVLLCHGQQTDTDSLLRHIYFDFDQYEITEESQTTLQHILNSEKTIQQIVIEANTDFRGSVQYNETLGNNRANTIKNYFLREGINEEWITIQNYGEAKPLYTNDTEDGMAKNRRVDILVLYEVETLPQEKSRDVVESTSEGLYDFLINNTNDINDLFETIEEKPQEFTIAGNDTFLVTKNGVLVEIPAKAFDYQGQYITISIIEGITIEQMIRNGFSTIDEIDRILQTGGMLDIKATINGQPIELKRPITLHIPTQKPLRNPQYFEGQATTLHDTDTLNNTTVTRDLIKWSPREQTIEVVPVVLATFEALPCCRVECITGESEALVDYWKKYDKASYEVYQSSMEKGSKTIVERCKKLRAKNAALLKSFQQQQEIQNTEVTDATYYVLHLPKLQSANVDIYLSNESKDNLVTVSTTIPANSGVSYFYISKAEKFIINAFSSNKAFQVPERTPLTILGIAKGNDNRTRVAILDIKAENKAYDLEFFPVSDKELDVILSSLNK